MHRSSDTEKELKERERRPQRSGRIGGRTGDEADVQGAPRSHSGATEPQGTRRTAAGDPIGSGTPVQARSSSAGSGGGSAPAGQRQGGGPARTSQLTPSGSAQAQMSQMSQVSQVSMARALVACFDSAIGLGGKNVLVVGAEQDGFGAELTRGLFGLGAKQVWSVLLSTRSAKSVPTATVRANLKVDDAEPVIYEPGQKLPIAAHRIDVVLWWDGGSPYGPNAAGLPGLVPGLADEVLRLASPQASLLVMIAAPEVNAQGMQGQASAPEATGRGPASRGRFDIEHAAEQTERAFSRKLSEWLWLGVSAFRGYAMRPFGAPGDESLELSLDTSLTSGQPSPAVAYVGCAGNADTIDALAREAMLVEVLAASATGAATATGAGEAANLEAPPSSRRLAEPAPISPPIVDAASDVKAKLPEAGELERALREARSASDRHRDERAKLELVIKEQRSWIAELEDEMAKLRRNSAHAQDLRRDALAQAERMAQETRELRQKLSALEGEQIRLKVNGKRLTGEGEAAPASQSATELAEKLALAESQTALWMAKFRESERKAEEARGEATRKLLDARSAATAQLQRSLDEATRKLAFAIDEAKRSERERKEAVAKLEASANRQGQMDSACPTGDAIDGVRGTGGVTRQRSAALHRALAWLRQHPERIGQGAGAAKAREILATLTEAADLAEHSLWSNRRKRGR